jgi:hypothetical protein
MMSSRLAQGLLVVVVLASLAGTAFQSPLKPGEEGAMFVEPVVLEQPMVAAQPRASAGEGEARNE